MNNSTNSLDFESQQTPAQSILICLALVYLAIPNILFLWGWFTPVVSLLTTLIIVAAIGRVIYILIPRYVGPICISYGRAASMCFGLSITFIMLAFPVINAGLLGFVPSYGDLDVLRNAMFANLRDAAWPLILPNGKEMSYYIANILPPALVARVFPAAGNWVIILWALPAMVLMLLLISSRIDTLKHCAWGIRLTMTAIILGVFCSPWPKVLSGLCKLTTSDLSLFGGYMGYPFAEWGWLYHSLPPTLLVTSILLVCRTRAEAVLPVALALLVPLSPMGGLALLPLMIMRWLCVIRKEVITISGFILDSCLPVIMAFLAAVYFLRADGENAVALTGEAIGWDVFLKLELNIVISFLTVFFPLFFVQKRDAFLYAISACYVLMPFIFIGTLPAPGKGWNNEMLLKSLPVYMLLAGFYWTYTWKQLGWYKYCFLGLCLFVVLHKIHRVCNAWGTRTYLQTDDMWNGHLNHPHRPLNQAVPYCNAPMISEVMMRSPGESENTFPGCLLPKAPGCDYSRPADKRDVLQNTRWW